MYFPLSMSLTNSQETQQRFQNRYTQYSKSLSSINIVQKPNKILPLFAVLVWQFIEFDPLCICKKLFAGGSLSIECLGLSLITEVYNFLPKETLFSFSHRLNFIDLMIPQQQQTLQRGPPECNLAQSFDSQIEGWFCQGRPNHLSKKIQHS